MLPGAGEGAASPEDGDPARPASEFDIPRAEEQGNLLNKAACAQKLCPQFLRLPKHSHMSEVYSINTPDVTLTKAILGFIKAH